MQRPQGAERWIYQISGGEEISKEQGSEAEACLAQEKEGRTAQSGGGGGWPAGHRAAQHIRVLTVISHQTMGLKSSYQ